MLVAIEKDERIWTGGAEQRDLTFNPRHLCSCSTLQNWHYITVWIQTQDPVAMW